MWFAFGVSFGRPAVAVVSLVLVCVGRVWRWFLPSRGCGGFVSFGLFAFGVGFGRCEEAGAKKVGRIKVHVTNH